MSAPVRVTFLGPWLANSQPRSHARLTLVCIPFAGGNAAVFHAWPRLFVQSFDVWSIELPGHGRRFGEKPLTSIADMATGIVSVLQTLPARPLVLFGHSMGAAIAFEVVRALEASGAGGVRRLCVAASPAPPQICRGAELHRLPREQFLPAVQLLNGIPAEMLSDQQFIRMYEPVLRADLQALETYRCTDAQRLRVPLSVFGGTDDPTVSHEDLQMWLQTTTGPAAVTMVPGDHFFLRTDPVTIADEIQRACEISAYELQTDRDNGEADGCIIDATGRL